MKTGEDFKVQLNRYVWKSRIILQNIWRVSDINVMNISRIYKSYPKMPLSGGFQKEIVRLLLALAGPIKKSIFI